MELPVGSRIVACEVVSSLRSQKEMRHLRFQADMCAKINERNIEIRNPRPVEDREKNYGYQGSLSDSRLGSQIWRFQPPNKFLIKVSVTIECQLLGAGIVFSA